ncbi:MAG: glycosyl transferase GT4 family protein [Methanobacteriaceae archaeon]|nr:glycosyl transferase GT4 family protein [Methanobacteriaceae archaeon]
MKKVLLIAFYFNQTNEIASKRLRALAKYLPQYGWEPIVIVPDLGNLNMEGINCNVVQTPYIDMMDKWMGKNKSNLSDESEKQETIIKDSTSVNNQVLSKIVSIAGEIFAYPDGMKYWYKPTMEAASKIIEEENIDAIITSSWPVTSHKIGKDLKIKYQIPWIADLRDLWNMNPYISHTHIRTYFEKRLEIKTFEQANVLTTTTPLAAETLSKLHPNNIIVPILSGFDPDDFKKLNITKTVTNDKLNLTYAGSLYQGKRDPTILFKALKELIDEGLIDSNKIKLNFYGETGNLKELKTKYELNDIVNIGGFLPHDDVLMKQANSDVLLLISWNNPKEKMFIPGKVYEYLALKRPVLSIGYQEGSLKNLIEDTKMGAHVSNLKDTKNALLNFYNEFISNGQVEFKANEKVNVYSMIQTAANFGKLLDNL